MTDAQSQELNDETPEPYSGEVITHSPEETFVVGQRIGEQLEGGEAFLLRGDLGAGKTVFAKGLAAGLGIDPSEVTSPSFTLINTHEGRTRFHHIDLYRIERGSEHSLGLDELFEDRKAVVAIEWPERLEIVPARAITVRISYVSDSERRISIS